MTPGPDSRFDVGLESDGDRIVARRVFMMNTTRPSRMGPRGTDIMHQIDLHRHRGTRRIAASRVHVLRAALAPIVTLAILATTANPVVAQVDDQTARLAGRLPADVEAVVLERIAIAEGRALPSRALADLALQGVAKGRSAEDVLRALDQQLGTLELAKEALTRGGRASTPAEIEAAGLALRMGADAEAVSALARSRPAGRALEVPLLVLGGLTQRGLPADQALSRVLERLAARVDDASFLADLPATAGGPPHGGPPFDPPAGPFSPGGVGPGGPPAGIPVPVGPAGGARPGRPDLGDRPGGGPPPASTPPRGG